MQACQQLLYRGTLFVLERLSSVYGDDSMSQETLLTVLEVAANDRYIVLQHLRNRRLTAASTGRLYDIHPQTLRNRLRQNVKHIRAYRPYFGQILTRRHQRQGGIGAAVTCTSDVLIDL